MSKVTINLPRDNRLWDLDNECDSEYCTGIRTICGLRETRLNSGLITMT